MAAIPRACKPATYCRNCAAVAWPGAVTSAGNAPKKSRSTEVYCLSVPTATFLIRSQAQKSAVWAWSSSGGVKTERTIGPAARLRADDAAGGRVCPAAGQSALRRHAITRYIRRTAAARWFGLIGIRRNTRRRMASRHAALARLLALRLQPGDERLRHLGWLRRQTR